MNFMQISIGLFIMMGLISLAGGAATILIHGGIKGLEGLVSAKVPAPDVAAVNAFLDTVDHLACDTVQSINNTLVLPLKQTGSFNAETAAAVKQQVIGTVLANLGPLKEQFAAAVGPLESVIGNAVEKHVLLAKGQTSTNAKSPA